MNKALSENPANTTPSKPNERRVQLAPSVMCCDMCHLEDDVRRLEELGVDMLHLDIMDGHFTPNMPLGIEAIKQLRKKSTLPFDAHLMVNDNDLFARLLLDAGVDMISVHVESSVHLDRTLSLIRDQGGQAGAALNPHTPVNVLEYVLDRLDYILIMTVNPGFAGQKLVPGGMKKLADCRNFLDERGYQDLPIQVDGNVSFENIPAMVAAGADILVCGTSSLFNKDHTLEENREKTVAAIREGLA